MMTSLATAAEIMHGVLHGDDAEYAGVSTDTRTVQRGELFFALSGPNFDGAEFVGQAAEQGAAGAVVAGKTADNIPQITVDDTKLALGRLGSAWRQQQTATVIGVTGSNGKTTLKEMIAACLAQTASTAPSRTSPSLSRSCAGVAWAGQASSQRVALTRLASACWFQCNS